MTGARDLDVTLPLMRQGTAHLLGVVTALGDADLAQPSRLPGWTRAHVLGHVARNAEALTRLAAWARTGVETPMYASMDQRAAEIDRSARLSATQLRHDLVSTADALDGALGDLTPEQWTAGVRSALGRDIPAAEIPWMRIREVWLHGVDLADHPTLDHVPAVVIDLLLDDTTTALGRKPDCPAVTVTPTDRDRSWHLNPATPGTTVTATAADLAGWLTGRLPGQPGWPQLPRWL